MVFWLIVGGVLSALLVVSWSMDRAARRRQSQVSPSSDMWLRVREGRRDAEILGNPHNHNVSWSSWSRRNGRR